MCDIGFICVIMWFFFDIVWIMLRYVKVIGMYEDV